MRALVQRIGSGLSDLRAAYQGKVAAAHLAPDEAARMNAALEAGLTAYTYLSDEPLA